MIVSLWATKHTSQVDELMAASGVLSSKLTTAHRLSGFPGAQNCHVSSHIGWERLPAAYLHVLEIPGTEDCQLWPMLELRTDLPKVGAKSPVTAVGDSRRLKNSCLDLHHLGVHLDTPGLDLGQSFILELRPPVHDCESATPWDIGCLTHSGPSSRAAAWRQP